jgi:hypothetical protein
VKKKIKNVQIKDVIEVKEDKEIMVYFWIKLIVQIPKLLIIKKINK